MKSDNKSKKQFSLKDSKPVRMDMNLVEMIMSNEPTKEIEIIRGIKVDNLMSNHPHLKKKNRIK